MAGISPEMTPLRVPVILAVQPWFFDHAPAGRAVLPMVEILQLLAAETKRRFPEIDVRVMRDGRFARFLELRAGAATMWLAVELEPMADGSVQAVLLRKKKLPGMTRMVEHARVVFSRWSERREEPGAPVGQSLFTASTIMDAGRVYDTYIPLGPAYRSLKGSLAMNDQEVRAAVQAPVMKQRSFGEDLLGSPFPLDGAMHAAAVLGRRHLGRIPLPVAFGGRVVHLPARPGVGYNARAVLRVKEENRLTFDLRLEEEQGGVCEEVIGLVMQEIV
ncbi:MAG TPA: hypothetical protein ENK89_02665 [Desulfobulbaceae bacterium]|nr:hypothetical protein [Desulfobulbaceae bacterium]